MFATEHSVPPLRRVRRRIGAFTLALGALLLPAVARAQGNCTTTSGVTTCTSTDVVSTPDEAANGSLYTASIYPSYITVPSAQVGTSTVSQVQVQLTNVDSNGTGSYLSVQGTEIVLAAPNGTTMELLGGPGNGSDTLSGLTMLIGDGFSAMPNGSSGGFPGSGTQDYAPSSYESGYGGTFPSPGPGTISNFPQTDGTATLASIFAANGGVSAAGNWNLWMVDNFGDPVTVNGWQLILTLNQSEVGTTTTISTNQQPAYLTSPNNTVTLTATVTSGGNPVTAGTVAFYANSSSTAITCSSGNQTLNSSGQATCGTTLSEASASQCSASTLPAWPAACQGITPIVATYSGSGTYSGSSSTPMSQLVEMQPTQNGATWCNTAPAPIQGIAVPPMYPSVIAVSGYPTGTTVSSVQVQLEGANGSAGLGDMFLLVAPNGQNLDFFDNGFSANSTGDINLAFYDTAGQFVPGAEAPTAGNYEATDNRTFASTFSSSTAPSLDPNIPQVPGTIQYSPYSLSLTGMTDFGTAAYNFGQSFANAPANGDWALYVNGYSGSEVSLDNGWCIALTLNSGAPTTIGLVSSQQMALTGQSVTFTATVQSDAAPVTSGTVTFQDNGLAPAGTVSGNNVVTLNGSGQAAFVTSTLAEGDHNITASYSGVPATYNATSASIYQREDNASAVSNGSSTGAQFCNAGGVTSPNLALGAFSPNPSNIFVSNLPGTISDVSLTLDNFAIPNQDTDIFGLESLLVGPQSALDFFSVNGGSAAVSTGNYTFADNGSVPLSISEIAPGTYQPASDDSTADTFFPDPGAFYTLPATFQYAPTFGSNTLDGVFGSSNPNGTWSLYFNQTENSTTGAQNGWCLNFTETAVSGSGSTGSVGPDANNHMAQGGSGSITLSLENNGVGPTGDPDGNHPQVVAGTLPAGLTFGTVPTGTPWNCTASTSTAVSCTSDSIIAQSSNYPLLTLPVNVASNAASSLTVSGFAFGGAGMSAGTFSSATINVDTPPAITSGNSATFTAGVNGSFNVATTGSPTPSIGENGTLPNGVTLTDNGNGTATLAGTPAAGTGGVYTFTITAQNSAVPNATQTFTLTVDQPPAITSANGTTFNAGYPGSFTVTATGYPIPAFGESGALPGTVTLTDNGNGTATLAGTAPSGNSYPITITASNGVSPNAQQSFTLTVNFVTTALTSPSPGSTLTGSSATFTWTAGSGATSYTLWLGTTGVGSNNLWSSGGTTATSATFGGLPMNGEPIYARLYATVSGVVKHYDYTFTAATAAALTSPTPGSTLPGTTATFRWTSAPGATAYTLWLGSTGAGSNNLWSSSATTATSATFNSLPINGATIYARLFTTLNGVTVHSDTTFAAVAAAVLTSPTGGSTFPGPSVTFHWSAPTGATAYSLWLGTTGVGSNNLWGSGSTGATTVTFGAMPTNGETIYVRLFSTVNGILLHTDATFTAASASVLTLPTGGSMFAGPNVTFQWTAPTGTTEYSLWLGSTGAGSSNIWSTGATTATSATYGLLPTNGETIYARLYSILNGFSVHTDYTFTAASAAVMTSPMQGSTLPGPSATFQWTASSGGTGYNLWLGSTGVGSNNIWSSGTTTSTSATFSNLPTNGETIYARLFTTLNGVSVHADYTYTAASAAVLMSPTPNSTFTGASETFQWTAVSSASDYSLWVGTTAGSNNLGFTQGGTTSTFFTLNTLPTNGETVHVRLYTSFSGGGSAHYDYSFTAYTAVSGAPVSHTIQISNDADDGYYNNDDNSGWHSVPQAGGADWVGSWSGTTQAWVAGYRFESTGINSGDTIQSAYLELWSSDGFATNSACGGAPCAPSNSTFRVYGVAQDDGPAFSNDTGNTPVDVPYTNAYTDYTTTGPGDDHGSCQGQNNGQNTCTHTIDVTAIVNEITARPGWTSTSSMRFVMLSTDVTAPDVYTGFEDYDANAAKAATLAVNPPVPTIVSSGAFGTSASVTYPTTYETGPFVYPGASTILLFLGDYYNFYNQTVDQPSVTDSCGNTWNILAGPTDWAGISYDMRSTVYYVQNPAACSAGDTITVTVDNQEPIFLHFLAIAGSDTTQAPVVSAITSPSPGTYTTSATSNSISLASSGLLVSWIFGDSDSPTTFTPQTGFITDPNSTPTYLTEASESVSTAGSYQSQFSISPSDGWELVLIGLTAPTP